MFNLTQKQVIVLLIESFLAGFVWFLFTLYIRRGMNPGATGEKLQGVMENRLTGKSNVSTWFNDSMYGGIATGCMFFVRFLVMKWVKDNY